MPAFHPLFLPAQPIPTADSQILISSVACPMSRHLRPPGQIPLLALPHAHLLPATFSGAIAFSFALDFLFPGQASSGHSKHCG